MGGWLQAPQHLHQDDTEDVVLFCTCRGSPQRPRMTVHVLMWLRISEREKHRKLH